MAVLSCTLKAVTVVVATGCYSPELRDCAVSCETSADCAPGQICGSDEMCATPSLAGRCARSVDAIDASIDTPRDAVTDARLDAAPLDAPAQLWIRIEISGRGTVNLGGVGTCHNTSPMHICTFAVPAGMVVQLEAEPAPGYRFDKWESGPCVDDGAICTFLPVMEQTEIKAKFKDD